MTHYQPAEWSRHRAVWTAWPSHRELWGESLEAAQGEFRQLCRAIASIDAVSGEALGEGLEVLVALPEQMPSAQQSLQGLPVRFHMVPFGDIWLRDTAPIFLKSATSGSVLAARFQFNGWGKKYILPHDGTISREVARAAGHRRRDFDFILEGGSIEVDGCGTALTTKQCLLNKNRNRHLSQSQLEERLKGALGLKKIIWLEEGLLNDHTDGHIDTIARFVAPGRVVCMESFDSDDPNRPILERIAVDLAAQEDAEGRSLEVIRIPSPGCIFGADGLLMPASYVNFYIGNAAVVVPNYGSPYDRQATEAIQKLFPQHRVEGCSAVAILEGGGAFHCITQQEPA